MKKLFSFFLAAAMLFALCATAFADSPAETDTVSEPVQEESAQTESVARSVQYSFSYDLDVNESAECSGFYGYYTAGTEISVKNTCTPGRKVTIHFWSDSSGINGGCYTVAYNEKDGGVILSSGGYWHVEVIANYNYACAGTILLTVDP